MAKQKTITIVLTKRDNEAIAMFQETIQDRLGVTLSPSKAARAMLHRAVAIEMDEQRSLIDSFEFTDGRRGREDD